MIRVSGVFDQRPLGDMPTDPPDEPPCCADCRFCHDIGIHREEQGVCVWKFQITKLFDDLEAVYYDSNVCEYFEEER